MNTWYLLSVVQTPPPDLPHLINMVYKPGLCLTHLDEVTKGDNITLKSGPGSLTEQLVHPPHALLPPSLQPDLPPTLATPPDILNYAMSTVSGYEHPRV